MISMKLSKKEKKTHGGPVEAGYDGPDYPWGLSITLDQEALKKLGTTPEAFRNAKSLTLSAKADVASFSFGNYDGKESGEVRLQITDLELGEVKMTKGQAFFADKAKGPGGAA